MITISKKFISDSGRKDSRTALANFGEVMGIGIMDSFRMVFSMGSVPSKKILRQKLVREHSKKVKRRKKSDIIISIKSIYD